MFLMDGTFGKIVEFCFTVMVCPKKMRNSVFGQWCLRRETRKSVFLHFQKWQTHVFLTLFAFDFAEVCFWVVGVARRIAEFCF